ncbi:MAG: hypothetical protein CSA11_08355 [Chloroflexi bacterium]|nr:MAG: hypothetical protein CSB13_00005 [Chloroflexota bacterium]PIE80320.1 MAG: hypothetical protein CSA11_08355 [Chloroflexota bacterium]
MNQSDTSKDSTLAALLKEKPKRGRPRRDVSRQNVYVALTREEKAHMRSLAKELPESIARADVPDLAVTILSARLEAMRLAVADRDREIPEGVTDFDSLYLLWDLPLPNSNEERKWTSIRLSPQEAIELGRVQGTLNAAFGATRSDTFSLGLGLLTQFKEDHTLPADLSLSDVRNQIISSFL